METPDPPSDTPGASKQVVLTPHDIPFGVLGMVWVLGVFVSSLLMGPWNPIPNHLGWC